VVSEKKLEMWKVYRRRTPSDGNSCAYPSKRLKWAFPITCHLSSVNLYILPLGKLLPLTQSIFKDGCHCWFCNFLFSYIILCHH
jgi:hypothetical protein